MPKYIDVDKTIASAVKERKFVLQKEDLMNDATVVKTVYADLKDFLYSQPDADVLEIVHAEWVDKYNNKYDNHLYVCSNCGGEALCTIETDELGSDRVVQKLSSGCPHCLAVMKVSESKMKNNTQYFKFIGQDYSMGLRRGKVYQVETFIKHNLLWVRWGEIACPYRSLETLLENWEIIEQFRERGKVLSDTE